MCLVPKIFPLYSPGSVMSLIVSDLSEGWELAATEGQGSNEPGFFRGRTGYYLTCASFDSTIPL